MKNRRPVCDAPINRSETVCGLIAGQSTTQNHLNAVSSNIVNNIIINTHNSLMSIFRPARSAHDETSVSEYTDCGGDRRDGCVSVLGSRTVSPCVRACVLTRAMRARASSHWSVGRNVQWSAASESSSRWKLKWKLRR